MKLLRTRAEPKQFSYWTLVRWIIYAVLLTAIEMGFYFKDGFLDEKTQVQNLITKHAEAELYDYLASQDLAVVQLATQGLWECWLNEKGEAARQSIDEGINAMNRGDFATADRIFKQLIDAHPNWAEALNKQATLAYLQHRPAESLALCEQVVALKPNHFGAWSGMALCAIQLEDWRHARKAARQAIRIQPHSESNRQILRAIDMHIPKLDV